MSKIRPATVNDLPAINDIYNQAVLNTTATFDTEPKTIEDRNLWFINHNGKYPVLVSEEGDLILGWASLSAYSDKPAYNITAEISAYVRAGYQRSGIGRQLTENIIREGGKIGLHSLLARITADNLVSIELAKSFGFNHVGVLKEAGRKFGNLLDVEILQYIYQT